VSRSVTTAADSTVPAPANKLAQAILVVEERQAPMNSCAPWPNLRTALPLVPATWNAESAPSRSLAEEEFTMNDSHPSHCIMTYRQVNRWILPPRGSENAMTYTPDSTERGRDRDSHGRALAEGRTVVEGGSHLRGQSSMRKGFMTKG